jgi:hypothetical protein
MAITLYQLARFSSFFSCFVEKDRANPIASYQREIACWRNLSMAELFLENMHAMGQ